MESIYESFNDKSESPSFVPKTRKIPLKDDSLGMRSENDSEHGDGSKMSAIMSALSMESLDSIGSLDDLSEDELNSDLVDGCFEPDDDILPKPHGDTYATEEMRQILAAGKRGSGDFNLVQVANDFHLELDKDAEYPAFDALRKLLQAVK